MNSPKFSVNYNLFFGWWKQKRRGSLFLRAYPQVQAFALPPSKDKQRKPAHAELYYISDVIYTYNK